MENIILEGTSKTPEIRFDASNGLIEIAGRSIPENSLDFYKPLINWVEEYAQNSPNITEVNVKLEYFNTSSSKCILDVFKKLEGLSKKGKDITINWYYEEDDEDMLEAGEDYQSIIKIPFKMIEMEE